MAMHSGYVRAKRRLKPVTKDYFTSPSLRAASGVAAKPATAAGKRSKSDKGKGRALKLPSVATPRSAPEELVSQSMSLPPPCSSPPGKQADGIMDRSKAKIEQIDDAEADNESKGGGKSPSSIFGHFCRFSTEDIMTDALDGSRRPKLEEDQLCLDNTEDTVTKPREGSKSVTRHLWPGFKWASAGPFYNFITQLIFIVEQVFRKLFAGPRAERFISNHSFKIWFAATMFSMALSVRCYAHLHFAGDMAKLTAVWESVLYIVISGYGMLRNGSRASLQYVLTPSARSLGWLAETDLGAYLRGQYQLARSVKVEEALAEGVVDTILVPVSSTATNTAWATAIATATSISTAVVTATATKTVVSEVRPTTQLYVTASINVADRAAWSKCKSGLMRVVAEAWKETEDGIASGTGDVATGSHPSGHGRQTFECIPP